MNDTVCNILQEQNITLDSVFRLQNNDDEFNCLPCIYWLPKMPKIPSDARFIIAGKKCINKQLRKHVTSAFKLCYSRIDAYYKNSILVGPKVVENAVIWDSFQLKLEK